MAGETDSVVVVPKSAPIVPAVVSLCTHCRKPVPSRRYALIIPMLELEKGDDRIQPRKAVRLEGDETVYQTPVAIDPERIENQMFLCLAHSVEDSVKSLELPSKGLFELRHNPPVKLVVHDWSEVQEMGSSHKSCVLRNGRMCKVDGFTPDGKLRLDYGVLQLVRAQAHQVAGVIEAWKKLLVEQLMCEQPVIPTA